MSRKNVCSDLTPKSMSNRRVCLQIYTCTNEYLYVCRYIPNECLYLHVLFSETHIDLEKLLWEEFEVSFEGAPESKRH